MNKSKLLLWLAGIVLILLIFAFCFDSANAVQSARTQLETVDSELKLQEARYIREISSFPDLPGKVTENIRRYQEAQAISIRHQLFGDLTTEAQKFLLGRDASSNQLQRKILDELSGALNRRQIAERHFQEALRECKQTMSSFRGTIGGVFYGDCSKAGT